MQQHQFPRRSYPWNPQTNADTLDTTKSVKETTPQICIYTQDIAQFHFAGTHALDMSNMHHVPSLYFFPFPMPLVWCGHCIIKIPAYVAITSNTLPAQTMTLYAHTANDTSWYKPCFSSCWQTYSRNYFGKLLCMNQELEPGALDPAANVLPGRSHIPYHIKPGR